MTLALERLSSVAAAESVWRPLADRQGNLFGTWEWATAWWATYGEDKESLLYAARRPGREPTAILPLYLALSGPLRLARLIGHGPADVLAPICDEQDRRETANALRRLVSERLGVRGLLLAERFPGGEDWSGALGAPVLRRESFPILDLAGQTWDEWLSGKTSHFRQQIRRLPRKLAREHDLQIRLVTTGDDIERDLEALAALHDARWNHRSAVFSPDRRRFFRAFTLLAADRGWLRLWFADIDGRPAAAWFGFRFAEIDWFYIPGRDPAFDSTRIGFVLLAHTLREAFQDGVRQYRFLLGDEPFKHRLMTRDPGVETLAVGTGRLPGVTAALVAGVRRVPAPARARVAERLGV